MRGVTDAAGAAFSSGCGTEIPAPLSGTQLEQFAGEEARRILHMEQPLRKSRESGHRSGVGQLEQILLYYSRNYTILL